MSLVVHRAKDEHLLRLRTETLEQARRFLPLPFDEPVADQLATLIAAARRLKKKAGAMDAIIAATAMAHDLVVWTQDDDFAVVHELPPN